MDAKAGSGDVDIDQGGERVAASTDNELVITYIAEGQISELRKFRVKVADGWSAPINDAAAADKMGTYTVTHERLNDEDEYADETGKVEKREPEKEDEDDEDALYSYMVARVASEQTVEKDDRITFTYSNATAPAMPEKSTFTFFFDGSQVLPDLDVLVQSAAGASAVSLSSDSDSFIIDDGGTLTVTVKLVADDGSAATQNAATTVTLSADGGTITSPVTIEAGSYQGEATLTADEPGSITITASATGLTDAEALMVTADTNNVMIDSVTVTPLVATVGSSVTVSATGTPAQDGTFTATNADGVGVQPSKMTEDESGSYTGMFDVVVDQHPDGEYTVTVSLNGKSPVIL